MSGKDFEIVTLNNHNQEHLAIEARPALRQLGAKALDFDGFIPLQNVESPYHELRRDLESHVIGQPEAIEAIIGALEMAKVRIEGDPTPMANFIFQGPTGVGKTEIGRALARFLSDDGTAGNLIKIDCSSFSGTFGATSLTGSPKGYVGYNDEPLLTKEKVEKPGTVIIFDEGEKGNKSLHDTMLQIMDDGRLVLANGEEINFRDAIIIITTNAGAIEMNKNSIGFDTDGSGSRKKDVDSIGRSSLKRYFRPEFLGRIDEIIVFNELSHEDLKKVVDSKLNLINDSLRKEFGILVSLSDHAKDHIIESANSHKDMGARHLEKTLHQKVLRVVGRHVGNSSIVEGTSVRVFHTSEAPTNYNGDSEGELIFTGRADPGIYKAPPTMATLALAAGKVYEGAANGSVGPDGAGHDNINMTTYDMLRKAYDFDKDYDPSKPINS